jgi:hypothetical protein
MTDEEAEKMALATILIDAMTEETDRAPDLLVGPKHAAEHPDNFFTEVPACDRILPMVFDLRKPTHHLNCSEHASAHQQAM